MLIGSHILVYIVSIRFSCVVQVKDDGLLDDEKKEEDEMPSENEEGITGTV